MPYPAFAPTTVQHLKRCKGLVDGAFIAGTGDLVFQAYRSVRLKTCQMPKHSGHTGFYNPKIITVTIILSLLAVITMICVAFQINLRCDLGGDPGFLGCAPVVLPDWTIEMNEKALVFHTGLNSFRMPPDYGEPTEVVILLLTCERIFLACNFLFKFL